MSDTLMPPYVDTKHPLEMFESIEVKKHIIRRGFSNYGIIVSSALPSLATVWVGSRHTLNNEHSVLARIENGIADAHTGMPREWYMGVVCLQSSIESRQEHPLTIAELALDSLYAIPDTLSATLQKLEGALPIETLQPLS